MTSHSVTIEKLGPITGDGELSERESGRSFRKWVDALPAAVYTTDGKGRLTHFNPACVELSGRTPELGTDHWCVTWKLYYPDGRPMRHDECPMALSLKEGRPIGGQAIAERPDGTRIWFEAHPAPLFDEQGNVVGGINLLVDITERKRYEAEAEIALRESQSRLQDELAAAESLANVSAELVVQDDVQNLYEKILDAAVTIMRSDFASMQMLYPERGTRGELHLLAYRGFNPQAAKHWEWVRTDSRCTCGVALHTRKRSIAANVETCSFMVGTDDQATYLQTGIHSVQSTPLVSRSGELLGMISTHWKEPHEPSERDLQLLDILARQAADLLERNKSDEALRKVAADLKDADRRKDEFLATLAHELRNPLAPVTHALELLRQFGSDNPTAVEARATMQRQLEQMVRLVDDLLDVSRITRDKLELRKEQVDLDSVVRSAVEGCKPLVERFGHELTLSLPSEPIYLEADRTRLAQVFGNLLNNACKYTERGGRIALTAERQDGEVVVRVRDNGIGVPPDKIAHLFDMFSQVGRSPEREHGGLGIGLHLVRRLVEMHGGAVSARSDGAERGSEFVVRLPTLVAARGDGSSSSNGVDRRTSTRRILVVDDNRDAAITLAHLLKYSGHDTQLAHDGAEAVEKAAQFRPDVVLLDIGLPSMNGHDACRAIRREPWGRDILIAALTGWGQEQDRHKSKDAGFDAHLVKPVDYAALMKLLSETQTLAAHH